MKKLTTLVLLMILVSSCYEKEKTFKCKTNEEVSKNYYYYVITVKDKEADVSTFTCLDGGYGKDKNSVYVYNYVSSYTDGRKLDGADSKTFEVIGFDYGRDKDYVYYHDNRIEGADLQTFEFINRRYVKDKNNIYIDGEKIDNAEDELKKWPKE